MKIDSKNNDYLSGNEFFHVKPNGDVLKGYITKTKGDTYISTEHSCSCGKDTYESYENAVKALNLRKRKKKEIYKCKICGYWHFTSKDGTKRHKKKYDKRTRNKPVNVIERDLKELKRIEKN